MGEGAEFTGALVTEVRKSVQIRVEKRVKRYITRGDITKYYFLRCVCCVDLHDSHSCFVALNSFSFVKRSPHIFRVVRLK